MLRELTIQKTSKYVGVCFDKSRKAWRASLYVNKRQMFLGQYRTEKEAAIAYDKAKIFFNIKIDKINLIDTLGENPSITRKKRREGKKPGLNISIYKGVSWNSEGGKWVSQVMYKGQKYFLGRYGNEVKAALAYDKAARYFFGDKAITNFKGNEMAEPIDIRNDINNYSSKYKGVSFKKGRNKWVAGISHKYLGSYSTEHEAVLAYNKEAEQRGWSLNKIENNN